MAKTNTEKPTGQAEKKKLAEVKTNASKKVETPKAPKSEKKEDSKPVSRPEAKKEESKPASKPEVQKEEKEVKKKIKRTEAKVDGSGLPISTKVAVGMCKFIRGKTIESAIKDLEEVSKLKKAVPMKGEYAHRKGRIMSGKYPIKASIEMLNLVKSLQNNANQADLENAIISTAIANKAMRPYAKGGRARKKRSHVTLIAKDKKEIKQNKKKK